MAESKRYYWLKLKSDFFQRDEIDFLMSQVNGSDYVVLYLMLCSQTLNNNGMLATNVGDVLVKYDVNKIARDTKYFNQDTIRVAFNFYNQLGLIYADVDGTIVISDYENYVGSSASDEHSKRLGADRQRRYRERKKLAESTNKSSDNNVTVTLQRNTEIDIENRDRYRDIDIDINNKKENLIKEKRFKKPTVEEVQAYILEKGYSIDAQHFVDYYESNGWKVGRNPMKDWKACVRTWNTNNKQNKRKEFKSITNSYRNEVNKTVEETLAKGEIF